MEVATTLALLRETLAYSRAIDLWGDKMIAADFHRPVARLRQAYKDVRLILENAIAVGAPSSLIEVVEGVLSGAWEAGLEDADTSAMIELARRTGPSH
jgi:3-hydroxyisobutyrate dehydrogenase-like beta-hydroxyacid dehydrogenase